MKSIDNGSAEKARCAFSHKNTARSSALDPHRSKISTTSRPGLGFSKRNAGGKKVRARLTAAALPGHRKLQDAMSVRYRLAATLAFASGIAVSGNQAYAQAGQLVYVANSSSSDVSVYQTNADGSLTAVTTIAGINTAEQAAVRGDQAFAYVSANGSNQVKVIDTGTNTVVQTVATGTRPFGVAVSPDGTRVYVANNGAGVNTVSVFSADALTGQLSALTTIAVGNYPRAIRFSSDGSRAYVANQDTLGGNGSVSVINTATNSVIATINTGGQLGDLAINPAGSRVYALDMNNNKVYVIDTSANTVVATPTADLANPRGILVNADGSRFYVTNVNSPTKITQFDAATNASLGTVATNGSSPGWMALSPDGATVYVAQAFPSNTVGIYSVSSGLLTAAGTIAADINPVSVGICGNGNAMLASGGTFIANTAGAVGCAGSSASFTGGTLRINGAGLAITTPMTLGSAGGTIDTNGNSATLSGIVGGSGNLTKSGTGTLTLSGANTYTGATAVNAGTLQAGAANVFGSNSAVTVAAGAVLDLNSFNQTLGSLAGAGNVTLGSATLTAGGNNSSTTYSGVLSGTGGLTKTGSGTLTLSGANAYTGATTVNAGTLQAGAANVFGSNSAMTVASGAVLDLNSFNQTLGSLAGAGNVTLGSATLTAGGNNSSTTYSGVLSGTGGVVKTGTGTLTLSGINSYTGGTTVSAGILQGDTASLQGNIANNAAVAFNQASTGTYSGVLSGTGSLTKSGAGTLTLSGANSYTGGTTVSAGTLQGDTASLQGNITDNATVTFNQASTGTYSSILSGTGSLAKTGAGTLTLSGANSYTGGTTVSAGTLQGDTASLQGNITDNAAVTFNQASTGTYSGVLSGTGSLTKSGTGLLILNGANTYSGATTVAAGTLEVGDINTPGGSIAGNVTVNTAGTLRGHGSITGDVTNSGSIMPGGSIGTLTVNGNVLFNPGSVFSVELSPSQTSLLNVTGGHTATLGGSVQVLAETGNYDFNTRYTILNAAGGVSGRFGGVTSNLAFLTPSLSYDANNVFLNLVRNDVSFSAVAATPNQRTLGGALNIVGGNDNLRTLLNSIVRLSAPQARSAYDSLSGVQNSYTQTLAIQQSQQFQQVLFDRLNGSSLSQDRDGSMPLAVSLTQGSLLNYNGMDWSQFLTGRSLGVAKGQGADKKERGLWLRGFGGFGDIKASANASGADYQSGGMALGIDGELNARATVGSAFGYTRTNGYTAGGNLDMDSFQGAAYGSWRDEGYYLNGTAGLGYHNADARRQVIAGNTNAQAASGHNIWTGTAAAEAGRNFIIRATTVTPFAGLAYTGLGGNGFTENGADAANLRVGDERQHSLQSSLGARLSRAWKTDGGMEIRPGVEAAYVHQYLDNVSRLNTRFNAAPDAGFIVEGPRLDRNRARLGAGIAAQLTKTALLNVSYNGDIAGSDQHHSFAATLKMQW